MMSDVLDVVGEEDIIALAKALSSDTRYKIAKLLVEKEMNINQLAKELGQTEANVSAQIKFLEKAGVLKSRYEPGDHGVRKVCKTNVKKIVIEL